MEQGQHRRARRVAALYDIPGNLAALRAVLADVSRAEADLVVVGGDIAWGPFPRETIELLNDLGSVVFIRGNADREVGSRFDQKDGLDDVAAAITGWCADRLTDEQLQWLRDQRETVTIDIEGLGPTLFCHGSPRNDEEMLTAETPPERLAAAMTGVKADTVVCGHTHMQFDIRAAGHRIVNSGSVGMPYEGKPGAFWTLFGPGIEPQRTTYEIAVAARGMIATGCPHVEMVFVDTITNPPSRHEITTEFEAIAAFKTF